MKKLTESNIADKDLLASTNKLLSHVGITAKQIISINELTRVASSMFVAIFEALFRTRVEGVVRRPKDTQDYISNCQMILDALSLQLQMDLRHITGESIFHGDRRALSNLVNILLRIATITAKSSGQNDLNHFGRSKGSESISSHESAFAHMVEDDLIASRGGGRPSQRNLELLAGEEEPATDETHRWGFLGGDHIDAEGDEGEIKKERREGYEPPPSFNMATSHDFSRNKTTRGSGRRRGSERGEEVYMGMEDNLDLDQLKSSLSEFEQYKKVEAARLRRESHLKQKVCQVSMRNTNSAEKSFQVFQKQWVDDNARDEYASLLRRKHEEHVMLRKVQKGILKHMREGQLDQSEEARARIQEIKKEARWHFQSLQTLFDDRVRTLRAQEMDLRTSQDQDVGNYKRVHDQLRQFNLLKQKKMLSDNKKMLQQKRLYSAQMRQDTHQQLLSYLATGEAWENTLRASWPPAPASAAPLNFHTLANSSRPTPNSPPGKSSIRTGHRQKAYRPGVSVYSPKAKTHVNNKKTAGRPKSAPQKQHRY